MGRCGAASILGWGEKVLDRWVDGEAERRRSKELVGAAVRLFRCTGVSLDGLGSTSG
jgi:hypothetical protein